MNLIEYPDRDMMAIDVAGQVAAELASFLLHNDRATLAVPGGTTPGAIFDDLCGADLEWDRVDILPTDERWVPEGHSRSNARLIKERLITARAATATYLPLYVPSERPENVLAELESVLIPHLPVSVMLLGMGADMHVASLFPQAAGLGAALASQAPILVPITPLDQPEKRVSLSARILREALSLHLVITGQEKRDALERARHLTPEEAPVATILNKAVIHWTP